MEFCYHQKTITRMDWVKFAEPQNLSFRRDYR